MTEPLVGIYRSLDEAEEFLLGLAEDDRPWTFDIETYDAAAPVGQPGRKGVSVNPFHPDFRVRGVAIAVSADQGYWIELGGLPPDSDELYALSLAFASSAEKGAFNGGFDECGLVYTGWVPVVTNRVRDGMLGIIGLGDGTHENVRLEGAIRVLLRREYHWEIDKGTMRDLPVDVVAKGAVYDACATHELCDLVEEWAEADKRIEWSRIGQENAKARQEAEAGQPEADPWLA